MVRVMRMVTADMERPSRMAGTIMCAKFFNGSSKNGVYSSAGAQRHQTEGNTITSVPSQNPGTASITSEKERAT